MCLRVGDPDGVQEGHKRFILVRAEECATSSEEGETSIILHRSACGRGYERARQGGVPRSQDESEVRVQLCQSPRKVQESCVFVSSCPLERSLHVPFIVSKRCGVTRCWYVA
jgi:hypothetical protein